MNDDLVNKVLLLLLKTWEPKVIAIQVAKDLKTLPLDHLLNSLINNEMMIGEDTSKEEER